MLASFSAHRVQFYAVLRLFGLRGACRLSPCVCSARTAALRHFGTAAFCRDQLTTAAAGVLTPCTPLNCSL